MELLDHSISEELKARGRGFDGNVVRNYTYQILQGARFLHGKNGSYLSLQLHTTDII